MTENTSGAVSTEAGGSVTAETSGAGSTGEKSASDVIRELKRRAQEAEAKLAEVAAKEEAAQQEKLKAAGKYEELESGWKAKLEAAEAEKARLAGIAEQFEAQQKATREATIATLPEAQREYAASLPPDKLPGFVELMSGTQRPAPFKPGEPGTVNTGKLSPAEIAEGIRTGGDAWLKSNLGRIVPG